MIGYSTKTVIRDGTPTSVELVFQDANLSMLTDFLCAESIPAEKAVSIIERIECGEEQSKNISGNMYEWTTNQKETTIVDMLSDDGKSITISNADFKEILIAKERELTAFRKSEKVRIEESSRVYQNIMATILDGKKIPHSTSRPVIRYVEGIPYLAVFVFFFSKHDIKENRVNRPDMWALADISDGRILNRYDCREKDFSSASFDVQYPLSAPAEDFNPLKYNRTLDSLLDSIRYELLTKKRLNSLLYSQYMELLIKYMPTSYHRFFFELSNAK